MITHKQISLKYMACAGILTLICSSNSFASVSCPCESLFQRASIDLLFQDILQNVKARDLGTLNIVSCDNSIFYRHRPTGSLDVRGVQIIVRRDDLNYFASAAYKEGEVNSPQECVYNDANGISFQPISSFEEAQACRDQLMFYLKQRGFSCL